MYLSKNEIIKMRTSIKNISTHLLQVLTFFLLTTSLCVAEFHGTIIGTTDYISRGYSKSDGHFAVQGNLDYEHASGLYLGFSLSTVDFGDTTFADRANVEIIPYLGWTCGVQKHVFALHPVIRQY